MEDHIIKQKFELLTTLVGTAAKFGELAKQYPKRARGYRIFIKDYNRRPMKKKKAAMVTAEICCTVAMGAAGISRIMSQPVPKYKKGYEQIMGA